MSIATQKQLWHCLLHQQEYGPLSTSQLREMAEQGQLTTATLVRPAQDAQAWRPLAECDLAEVAGAIRNAAAPTPQPSRTNRTYSQSGEPWSTPPPVSAMPPESEPTPSFPAPEPVASSPAASSLEQTPLEVTASLASQPAVAANASVVPTSLATTPPATTLTAPVGTPLPAASAAASASPISAPEAATSPTTTVGPAIDTGASGAPVIASSTENKASSDPRMRFRQRKKSPMPLIVGGGVALLVGVIGLVAFVMRDDDAPKQTVSSSPPSDSSPETTPARSTSAPAEEANPASPVDPTGTTAAPPADSLPNPANTNAGEPTPQNRLDRSGEVRKWAKRTSRISRPRVGMASIKAAWIETVNDAETLHVQVGFNYQGETPVRFSSWASADEAKRESVAARLVYGREQGSVTELSMSMPQAVESLTNGDSFTETLRFPAPSPDVDVVRLVLPVEAIGRTESPIGFEITKVEWEAGMRPSKQDVAAATTQPPDAMAVSKPAMEIGPATAPEPTDSAAPPKKKKDDDGIPSFDDLQKSIKSSRAGDGDVPVDPEKKN